MAYLISEIVLNVLNGVFKKCGSWSFFLVEFQPPSLETGFLFAVIHAG